jgi:hypothetical protein
MENTKAKKTCFVICPFGKVGSDERKASDTLVKHLLSDVLREMEYSTIERTLESNDPGDIMKSILDGLYNADLVVADISGSNPNVFYELGLRHSVGKPVILISEDNETAPFDIKGISILKKCLVLSDDLVDFKKALKKQIGKIEKYPDRYRTAAFLEHPLRKVSPFSSAGADLQVFKWKIEYSKGFPAQWRKSQEDDIKEFLNAYEEAYKKEPREWTDAYPRRLKKNLIALAEYRCFLEYSGKTHPEIIDLAYLRSPQLGNASYFAVSGWANWRVDNEYIPIPVSGYENDSEIELVFTQPKQRKTIEPDVWVELPSYDYRIHFKKSKTSHVNDEKYEGPFMHPYYPDLEVGKSTLELVR